MTEASSYWNKCISRRTALRASALGGALSSLAWFGCGSNDDKNTKSSSSASEVVESTKGKPGGTLKVYIQSYPTNFGVVTTANNYTMVGFANAALLEQAWGVRSVDSQDFYNYGPDVARALPEQPDDTTYVFKIRPNVKFHNGRALTIEDVKYSVDRGANLDKSVWRQKWQYFLERTETPDRETLLVKTKFPFNEALIAFAGNQMGYVMAKEHEEGPNAATEIMGAGPFVYSSTTAPVATYFKRNPEFHLKPYPYVDSLEVYTGSVEKQLADFFAKQVHLPFRVSFEQAAEIRKVRPDAKDLTWESGATSLVTRADRPPYSDKRVRQALSMAIDRKKIRDAVTGGYGRDDQFFTVALQKLWGFRAPKDLPQAKLWEYNPTAAKQLLSAAGVTQPMEGTMLHYDAAPAGQWFPDTATLLQTTYKELGIANYRDETGTQSVVSPRIQDGKGYEAVALTPNTGFPQGPEFVAALKDEVYWDPVAGKSERNQGWTRSDQLNALVDKLRGQLKKEDQKATYRQMEEIMAEECTRICQSTNSRTFFWDPSLANANMSIVQGSWAYMAKWWFA